MLSSKDKVCTWHQQQDNIQSYFLNNELSKKGGGHSPLEYTTLVLVPYYWGLNCYKAHKVDIWMSRHELGVLYTETDWTPWIIFLTWNSLESWCLLCSPQYTTGFPIRTNSGSQGHFRWGKPNGGAQGPHALWCQDKSSPFVPGN